METNESAKSEHPARMGYWTRGCPGPEAAILGVLLIDAPWEEQHAKQVFSELTEYDFEDGRHRTIYRALLALHTEKKSCDNVGVSHWLRDRDLLESVGGLEYILDLPEMVATSTRMLEFKDMVKADSMNRRMKRAALEVQEDASLQHLSIEERLTLANESLRAVQQEIPSSGSKDGAAIVSSTSHVLTPSLFVKRGISFGMPSVEMLTGEMLPGQLWILGARPKVGKSAFSLGILLNLAFANVERKALLISLEMKLGELGERMIAARCEIPLTHVRKGIVTDEERERVLAFHSLMATQKRLRIEDGNTITIPGIEQAARRMKDLDGLDFLVLDYLQLVTLPPSRETRAHDVAVLTRRLKALAGELEIPILALSQLNREPDRQERAPRLSDLRESGALEQDADSILFLHREELLRPNDASVKGKATLMVAAQRSGPTGNVDLLFQGEFCRFRELPPPF